MNWNWHSQLNEDPEYQNNHSFELLHWSYETKKDFQLPR